MLMVGLTGGIGSGKSEVTRRLVARGAQVVDADVIAREVVAPGTPGLAAVVEAFGPQVLAADGSLDRPALGAIVFADPAALARLNAIVHPLIGARTAELTAAAEAADPDGVLVHDLALLVEGGLAQRYDVVVVVAADPATQVDRLVHRRGMTEAEARARIAAQAPLADKLAIADEVIHNDGDLADLDRQVDALWDRLTVRRTHGQRA